MNGSTDLDGVHCITNALNLEQASARLPASLPRLQLNNGVLRWKMRWPFVFMVVFHCLWV